MAKQSLFSACKRVFRDGISGTYTVGNNDIFLELYNQQDIDNNNEIGNSSEENIVVVAGDTITIPEGYILTPVKPKKSLVIICNTFVNNGTVSMYQKAPNVLPHDLFIVEKGEINSNQDVIIPAYANNAKTNIYIGPSIKDFSSTDFKGNNGTDRQCGSGGLGSGNIHSGGGTSSKLPGYGSKSGSGYAFGGGAGSGGVCVANAGENYAKSVDSTYPMRGGDAYKNVSYHFASGGVGNPKGNSSAVEGYGKLVQNNFGCGGRIIIFCCNFINNGIITVNGTSTNFEMDYNNNNVSNAYGGASGAGAVDLFYTALTVEGVITAEGGLGGNSRSNNEKIGCIGSGGDGSITLTSWVKTSILKPIEKYMSKENMVYFLTNYIQRLKQGED